MRRAKWGAITVVVVAQPVLGKTMQVSTERSLGTVAGGLLGFVCVLAGRSMLDIDDLLFSCKPLDPQWWSRPTPDREMRNENCVPPLPSRNTLGEFDPQHCDGRNGGENIFFLLLPNPCTLDECDPQHCDGTMVNRLVCNRHLLAT